MKTASLLDAPASTTAQDHASPIERWLAATPRMVARLMRKESDSFAAIALAEGGDVEGACDLFGRSTDNRL